MIAQMYRVNKKMAPLTNIKYFSHLSIYFPKIFQGCRGDNLTLIYQISLRNIKNSPSYSVFTKITRNRKLRGVATGPLGVTWAARRIEVSRLQRRAGIARSLV